MSLISHFVAVSIDSNSSDKSQNNISGYPVTIKNTNCVVSACVNLKFKLMNTEYIGGT